MTHDEDLGVVCCHFERVALSVTKTLRLAVSA